MWSTLKSCLEKDGLIEDSTDYLDKFPNVVFVNSNLDETQLMKLSSWKEDLEGRLDSLGISSMEVWNEEECGI